MLILLLTPLLTEILPALLLDCSQAPLKTGLIGLLLGTIRATGLDRALLTSP